MKTKYLIIGGGVSGIALSRYLKKDYLIIEKDNQLGGLCRSFYQDDFVWDYGGHFLHSNKEYIKDLIELEGVIERKKSTKIYFKDRYIDFPFQNNIDELEKRDYHYCLNSYNKRKQVSNPSDFLTKLYSSYGKGIVNLFLKPYNEKLYACNLKDLDIEAMGRFFPSSPLNLEKKGITSYNDVYYANKKGANEYIKFLLKGVNKKNILLNCECQMIDKTNKQVITNKGIIEYDYLINTMPFKQFLKCLDEEKYQKYKECFNSNKVIIFNLGFDKKAIVEYDWIYYPSRKFVFYRVGFYSNIFNQEKMSLYVEIGYKQNQEINEERLLKRVIKDLKKAKIVTDHKLLAYKCVTINPAYVHINSKSLQLVNELKKMWSEEKIFTIGRYGNWTYNSINDCLSVAMNLAKEIGSERSE